MKKGFTYPCHPEHPRCHAELISAGLKAAFTLAEVLITLTIIGVVAAMTIPTVVKNYQETQSIAQLKKVQTTFEQAVSGARLKYGPVATWDVVDGSDESTARVVSYLKPYLKIIRDCGNTPGCWSEQNTKTLNGGQLSSINNRTGGNEYAITLVDGVNVNFDVYTQGDNVLGVNLDRDTLSLFVDVNGNKKPNTLGRDVFVFFIKAPGEIVPAGVDNNSARCKKTDSGVDCAAKVLKEGKINYLK